MIQTGFPVSLAYHTVCPVPLGLPLQHRLLVTPLCDGEVAVSQGFRPPYCLSLIGNGTFQRNLWVAGKCAGFHGKPPVCMLHPARGGENKKTLCRHLNALHSVSKHTQRLIRMLAEVPQVVYNNFRCEIESHCVGGRIACAGYGELALPIAAVLFLLLPITTE